jgi:hypothetical protein
MAFPSLIKSWFNKKNHMRSYFSNGAYFIEYVSENISGWKIAGFSI